MNNTNSLIKINKVHKERFKYKITLERYSSIF